jgi:transcriptional regulator with XRE-family HTH domain
MKPKEFGNYLKALLYERGLTQEWLAERVQIAPASLSRAMRGTRNPSAELVLSISAALELSPAEGQKLLRAAGFPSIGEKAMPDRHAGAASSSSGIDIETMARDLFEASISEDRAHEPSHVNRDVSIGAQIERLILQSSFTDADRALVERLILDQARGICNTIIAHRAKGAN